MSASGRWFHWATLNPVFLSCKVFGKNTARPKGGVELFFKTRRALTLQDNGDTELPLPDEISGYSGNKFLFHSINGEISVF